MLLPLSQIFVLDPVLFLCGTIWPTEFRFSLPEPKAAYVLLGERGLPLPTQLALLFPLNFHL